MFVVYREEVSQLIHCCSQNHHELNSRECGNGSGIIQVIVDIHHSVIWLIHQTGYVHTAENIQGCRGSSRLTFPLSGMYPGLGLVKGLLQSPQFPHILDRNCLVLCVFCKNQPPQRKFLLPGCLFNKHLTQSAKLLCQESALCIFAVIQSCHRLFYSLHT